MRTGIKAIVLLSLSLAIGNDLSAQGKPQSLINSDGSTFVPKDFYPEFSWETTPLYFMFQDTDRVQYEILRAIYQAAGLSLFLVGDPKQAIYSFRGADLFAYRKARQATASEIHCLDQNWRSTAELVQGVNTLFSQAPKPFYYDWIEFQPALAAKRSMDRLKIRGESNAGLRFWQLPFDVKTSVETVRQLVAEATAEEIARLLLAARQKRAMIGKSSSASWYTPARVPSTADSMARERSGRSIPARRAWTSAITGLTTFTMFRASFRTYSVTGSSSMTASALAANSRSTF